MTESSAAFSLAAMTSIISDHPIALITPSGPSTYRQLAAPIILATLLDWLEQRAGGFYGGEAITQLEHALQCAELALEHGASASLISAALLHDIGHLADGETDETYPHGELASALLSQLFGPAVIEPVRMHVEAKRYLCAADPLYWSGLSPASRRSLEWQGGPYTAEQADIFIRQPYADDAVQLRLWDDAAKQRDKVTLPLAHFVAIMQEVMIAPHASGADMNVDMHADLHSNMNTDVDTHEYDA
ncbi:HD domain-containing protein [Undibacterium sp. SXout7W]|uniref:HD domain-containing protein n=1 Tax=Undibacterium sp. SXout7W TaxID=3413049 RepID=UPI003BF25930